MLLFYYLIVSGRLNYELNMFEENRRRENKFIRQMQAFLEIIANVARLGTIVENAEIPAMCRKLTA